MTSYSDLFAKNAGVAFARQLAFADFLGQRNWSVNLDEGTVRFGRDLQFPIQLLGSEADGDLTWLWAWANEQSGLPEPLLTVSRELRELGVKHDIRELAEPGFSLDIADGHSLSMIASGMRGDCCYYRGPHPGGAVFFLVNDVPAELLQPVDAPRVLTVITQVISTFELDHRQTAESFLRSQQFDLTSASAGIVATRGEDSIELTLDDQGRISQIGGKLQAPPRSAKKPWWKFW